MSILLAAAIIAGSCVITCTLLTAVLRRQGRAVLLTDTTRGAGIYGVVGTSFAVLLAFVVFVAFQSYNNARQASEAEADSVLEEYRAAAFFPPANRDQIEQRLYCYGLSVIHLDWPSMREGQRNPVTSDWSLALQARLVALPVETAKEAAAFGNILDLRDERIDARRGRVSEGTPIITTPVWFFLILGALVNIGFVLLFVDRKGESALTQTVLMASVTTMVVSGLLLVWFLDHPYEHHTGGIQPTEMQRAVGAMLQEGAVQPLCDGDGHPLARSES